MTQYYNQNEREFKWSQWSPQGMLRCGTATYRQIMKWMQELGMDAKRSLTKAGKDHAIYGMKIHDDQGRITEIRLYCDTYVNDDELETISRTQPLNTLYVAHK